MGWPVLMRAWMGRAWMRQHAPMRFGQMRLEKMARWCPPDDEPDGQLQPLASDAHHHGDVLGWPDWASLGRGAP